MNQQTLQKFIDQSLFVAYDHIHNGRFDKAQGILTSVQKISDNVTATILLLACQNKEAIHLPDVFGQKWTGQNLLDKTIFVYCDQGMGDLINLLRYVKYLEDRWNVTVIVNCYAYYKHFKTLMEKFSFGFTNEFVKCDYYVNLMELPFVVEGIPYEYPPRFQKLVERHEPLPVQLELKLPQFAPHKPPVIGFAWQSNLDNPLGVLKSIPINVLEILKGNYDFVSMVPGATPPDFVRQIPLPDVMETVTQLNNCDAIVSVDTMILHLGGFLNKPTIGLLHDGADPRWGSGENNIWYPSVTCYRQQKAGDWSHPLKKTKKALEKMFQNI